MPTYNILRSYLVVESHEVQAKTYDEAIQMIENNPYETMHKSYDGDYDRNEDGSILYTLEGYEEDEDGS